jgi:hypothetical protein
LKNRLDHVAVVLSGDGCRQVAEMFGITDIVTVDRTEMDEFVQAVIFTREGNCITAHHDRPYTDNIIGYLNNHLLTFTDYYKYAVYGMSKDARPAAPTALAEFDEKERVIRGKTLIVAPYAKSVAGPPPVFWEKLIDEYRRKGFLVCTYVFGDEKPLTDTEAFFAPLNRFISAIEYAGHFIGLRSGLCDIADTAKCRKAVVFPDCIYSTTPHKTADFFAMPGWDRII